MFQRTTAVDKILALTKRKKVIQGGTSASKTYGVLAILIDRCAKIGGLEVSVISESIPHLRRGAIKDCAKIMLCTNRWVDSRWNRTLLTYNFANGSFIEFFSVEEEGKVRGARRNILYVNEANNIDFDVYHQLAIRTSHDIYLDFNPTGEFWAHTEVLKEQDSELLVLTYLDNEALPNNVLDDIATAKEKAENGSKYWQNWCRVYVDGKIGILQGAVFENWEVVDELPKDAKLLGGGIDFGWRVPSACVLVYELNGEYIFDELIYEPKLFPEDMAEMIIANGFDNETWFADNAEPKSIARMRKSGVRVHKCDGKTDLINYAIGLINRKPFYVTKKSINIIRELHSYIWDMDSKGQPTGKPRKKDDHAMNALCYFVATDGKYDGVYR